MRRVEHTRYIPAHTCQKMIILAKNDRKLIEKGWEDKKLLNNGGKVIQRKSTGQTVRSESHGKPHHYHWLDYWEKPFVNADHRKFKEREFRGEKVYYDKYGNLTHWGDPAHHIYSDEDF